MMLLTPHNNYSIPFFVIAVPRLFCVEDIEHPWCRVVKRDYLWSVIDNFKQLSEQASRTTHFRSLLTPGIFATVTKDTISFHSMDHARVMKNNSRLGYISSCYTCFSISKESDDDCFSTFLALPSGLKVSEKVATPKNTPPAFRMWGINAIRFLSQSNDIENLGKRHIQKQACDIETWKC